jgi:hypothetical protein
VTCFRSWRVDGGDDPCGSPFRHGSWREIWILIDNSSPRNTSEPSQYPTGDVAARVSPRPIAANRNAKQRNLRSISSHSPGCSPLVLRRSMHTNAQHIKNDGQYRGKNRRSECAGRRSTPGGQQWPGDANGRERGPSRPPASFPAGQLPFRRSIPVTGLIIFFSEGRIIWTVS